MRDVKLLMDGITLGECPRWHDGRLWFSDWGARQLIAVDMQGRHEVFNGARCKTTLLQARTEIG